MTVAELIQALDDFPGDAEVVIVHSEWHIKAIEMDHKRKQVKLK